MEKKLLRTQYSFSERVNEWVKDSTKLSVIKDDATEADILDDSIQTPGRPTSTLTNQFVTSCKTFQRNNKVSIYIYN